MISSFGAILAWKSDDEDNADDNADADDDYDDDRKSDPYMSSSYAGDTKTKPSMKNPSIWIFRPNNSLTD